MSQIHVLDQSTIDKIAAGEVVERPASVAKELVENAIDAGADRITIEIRDGGASLLRVTDNGRGIAAEEVPLAFLRHATSKISEASDLRTLHSLGFRGEALSSIAAVSRVELITKRPEDLSACRYVIEGGREKGQEEIGAPDGTTLIVRDLFYNTPARAKFLKTPMTEAAHVGSFVEQLILSNPGIAFTFLVNGQKKLVSSGSGKMTDALYHIYGRELVRLLIPLRYEESGICIEGMIGKPEISRGNRNFESFYINGRYVKSKLISRAIEDGYGTKLMQHQYPFACLRLEMETEAVDVNVHPTKMEVRFSGEKQIYDSVRTAVHDTLRDLEMIVAQTGEEKIQGAKAGEEGPAGKKQPRPAEPFEEKAFRAETKGEGETAGLSGVSQATKALRGALLREPPAPYAGRELIHDERAGRKDLFEGCDQKASDPPVKGEGADGEGQFVQQTFAPRFLSREAGPARRIVGQVLDTYWICEYEGKVFVFDQHAAHERVLYEKLMRQYALRELSSQQLSPPMLVTLDAREEALLGAYGEAFSELGFEIDPFGERDYAIRAVPYTLGSIDSAVLFRELLDQLEVTASLTDMKLYIRKVATEACKAAVKGGGKVSEAEASRLLEDLLGCEDPYHCPHGRPTLISFDRAEIEKRFKRIV